MRSASQAKAEIGSARQGETASSWKAEEAPPQGTPRSAIRHGLLVFGDGQDTALPVAGLSLLERGVRTMHRAGIRHLIVVVPRGVTVDAARFSALHDLRVQWAYGIPPKKWTDQAAH